MLTELDNCILGIIWREQPMSSYDVRSHLAGSTTAAWSSSTGTVYPSIKRLSAAGLVEAGPRSGPRKRQLLSLTDTGLAALREWLTDVQPDLGSSTADPLRTRVHFLAALAPAERERAFDAYRSATKSQIELLQHDMRKPVHDGVERSERLGILGSLMELRARLEWLETVRAEIMELSSAR